MMRVSGRPVNVRCPRRPASGAPPCPFCRHDRRVWEEPFSDIPGLYCPNCHGFERRELPERPLVKRCRCGCPVEVTGMVGETVYEYCPDCDRCPE